MVFIPQHACLPPHIFYHVLGRKVNIVNACFVSEYSVSSVRTIRLRYVRFEDEEQNVEDDHSLYLASGQHV